MDFLNSDLVTYRDELFEDNLYIKLSYEEREKIEKDLMKYIKEFSINLETILQSDSKGVRLDFYDGTEFKIFTELDKMGIYRGIIKCSRLLLIGTYQMFYSMDYSNLVIDNKNVENVKSILFNMAFMCLFYHELTHIYKGHLKLYKQWVDKGTIKNHLLDIRTLEWDADNYAATRIAEWILRIKKELLPMDTTDFAMKIGCGAIHGMLYWQRQQNDFKEISEKEHLPILYREITMLQCIGDLCGNLDKILLYVKEYEMEFNRNRKMSNFDIEKYFKNMTIYQSYLKEVEDNWEKLSLELENYSIFSLDEIDNLSI